MLSSKTLFGAAWLVSSRMAGRAVDMVTLLFLARALSPADFGLTALAASLISIVDMALEVPLGQALTRLRDISKTHLDTAFTLALLRGAGLSLVLLSMAWPFSLVFHDHRLGPLVCALAVGPVSRSLYSPAMVRFVRDISFRQAFTVEILGKIIASATAVTLAHAGAGYWAIVANSVLSPALATMVSHIIAPYRPALSLKRIRDFASFVGWFSSSQLLAAASWQVDRGILGLFVAKATLGKYTMASDLSVLPTQSLIGPAMQPVMAALARIADDRPRLTRAYLNAANYAMMVAVPAGIGIALTADLIVKLMLGPKWVDSIYFLRWLAASTVLTAFYQPLSALAVATDRPVVMFRFSLVEISIKILLIALGFHVLGLRGVVAARGAVAVIMFVVVAFTASRLVGVSVVRLLASLWRVALSTLIMIAAVLLVRRELAGVRLADVVDLGATALVGAGAYAASLWMLGVRLPNVFRSGRGAGKALAA